MTSASSMRCAGETGRGMTCSDASSQLAAHQRAAVAIGDERAPQIAAVVGVLHVHIDFDVGASDGDNVDTALAVGRRRPNSE